MILLRRPWSPSRAVAAEVALADPFPPSGELHAHVTRPAPETVVLHVAGEVDTLTAPALDSAVTTELELAPPRLVLDLTGVTFLASRGLAVLVRAAALAEERGTRVELVSQRRAVLRPLEITRTTHLFTIHSTLDEALASGTR